MRWLVLILIIAGVAGYFTRPTSDEMSSAANKFLSNSSSNPIEAIGNGVTALTGERSYSDYYVVTKYTVGDQVTCWGGFKQISCSNNKPSEQK